MSVKRKLHLTEQERQMYKSERLDNFRWISRIVASYSKVELKDTDKVPTELCLELSELGQFAEIVYSTAPIEALLKHHDLLSRPGFPLEGYAALADATLEKQVVGDVADLPAAIFWRPSHQQVVISICGTKLAGQALQDVRVLKTVHPSGKGNVHTGFWSLYVGLRDGLKEALRDALELRNSTEIVLTGHSMGGAVAYLLAIDLLTEDREVSSGGRPLLHRKSGADSERSKVFNLKLATYGVPRVGDEALVRRFHDLADSYRAKHGDESFSEFSVRAYSDGVPALPPLMLGYRHFSRYPLYATGGGLYNIPPSESERTLFHVQKETDDTQNIDPFRFPRGGHNYYGGRELERLQRRIVWLEKSDFFNGNKNWEDAYLAMPQEGSTS